MSENTNTMGLEIEIFTPGTYRLVRIEMPEELLVFADGGDVTMS